MSLGVGRVEWHSVIIRELDMRIISSDDYFCLREISDHSFPVEYLLTRWSRVILEKLTGSELVKKFPHFMDPEGSLPHSQVPAICPYPEPARSSPYPHVPLPDDPS